MTSSTPTEHIMLDLETMGNGPDAAIVAIGAVAFNPDSGQLGPEFLALVDLESSVASGGVMDPSTVLWWLRQSAPAREAFTAPAQPIQEALVSFTAWVESIAPSDKIKVWGNGSEFDNVILAGAYRRARLPLPWQFWNNRCYRTVKGMFPGPKIARTGTHHNALDDARSQAVHLCQLLHSIPAPEGMRLVPEAEWTAMEACISALRVDAELVPCKILAHLDAIRTTGVQA